MSEQAPTIAEVEGFTPGEEAGATRLGRLRSSRELQIGIALVLAWGVIAIFAPLIAPHTPYAPTGDPLSGPSGSHPFGTDKLGFDVFSRVVYAPRLDLYIATAGTAIAAVIGWAIGVAVGYSRRLWSDGVVRVMDALQVFPLLVLALTFVAAVGKGPLPIIAAIAFVNVPIFARLVRSQVLTLRELRFVEAAIAVGNPTWRVLAKHVLPNTVVPVLVQASISVALAVLITAGLSFLGVGITPPSPEWGWMIANGTQNIVSGQWWISVFPGLAVATLVLGFHLIGDGLTELLQRARRS